MTVKCAANASQIVFMQAFAAVFMLNFKQAEQYNGSTLLKVYFNNVIICNNDLHIRIPYCAVQTLFSLVWPSIFLATYSFRDIRNCVV
jgi:hypothetical protein